MKRQTDYNSPADMVSPLKSERTSSQQIVPKLSLAKCTPLSPAVHLDQGTMHTKSPRSLRRDGQNGIVPQVNIFTFGKSSTALFSEKSTEPAERGNYFSDSFSPDLANASSTLNESSQSRNSQLVSSPAGAPFQFRQLLPPTLPPSDGPRSSPLPLHHPPFPP